MICFPFSKLFPFLVNSEPLLIFILFEKKMCESLWIPIIDLYMHIRTWKKNVAGNYDLCEYNGHMEQKYTPFY